MEVKLGPATPVSGIEIFHEDEENGPKLHGGGTSFNPEVDRSNVVNSHRSQDLASISLDNARRLCPCLSISPRPKL